MLMNALERYRQARKMGWSRAQNKEGVTTFESFELQLPEDRALIGRAISVLDTDTPLGSAKLRDFVADLIRDHRLRCLVFVQDVIEETGTFESATVSLGRVSSVSRRFRDRLDIIVDRRISNGVAGNVERVRTYVDPFELPIHEHPAVELRCSAPSASALALFGQLERFYGDHAGQPSSRQWRHWTQDYIDYFGPRTQPVLGTAFPTEVDRAFACDPPLAAAG